MGSSQSSDYIGGRVSLERQVWTSSSCGWESELEVSVRGLFVGVAGLARLFHLSACFLKLGIITWLLQNGGLIH
jgi:hypothetical protein